MNKKGVSLTMEVIIIAAIVLIFIVVSSVMSGKMPKLFESAAKSPFDEVCCCKKNVQNDCSLEIRRDCEQKIDATVADMKLCK